MAEGLKPEVVKTPEQIEAEKFADKSWYGPFPIESEDVDNESKQVTLTFFEVTNAQGAPVQQQPVTLDLDMYNAAVTKTKSDLSSLRDRRVRLVVADILALLLKRNVKLSEFEYLIALLNQSINASLEKSNELLWGSNQQERTMQDVDKVLKTNTGPAVKNSDNGEPKAE